MAQNMSSQGLHTLSTIIKRLEAATSRLEDLAMASANGTAVSGSSAAPEVEVVTATATAVAPPPPPPPPAPINETPVTVEAYDDAVVQSTLVPFVSFTKSFAGSIVVEQVDVFEAQFATMRSIILMASACKKPDEKAFLEILRPLQSGIELITRFKNSRRSEWDNHISMIAESIQAVGWVATEPKPALFIKEMIGSAQFYGNRLFKEYKDKDDKHIEWVKKYIAVLEALRKYVLDYHAPGLAWNSKGISVSEYKLPSAGGAASSPPPPPPPPPPPVAGITSTPTGGVAAVFAEINRGEDITKGLRKVDKSEMTHKNPALRATSVVPAATAPLKKPTKPSKPPALAGKKPSKFGLEGNKWIIEFCENDEGLIVDNTELSQTVNVYGCKNVTIQVKGKINAVTIANSSKVSILVDSVVSSISITKSPSFALQVTGKVPTMQIDSTDSGQIYLSTSCLDAEINTSQSSAINVNIPTADGDFTEAPVPETLKSVVKDGKLYTTIVEHSG